MVNTDREAAPASPVVGATGGDRCELTTQQGTEKGKLMATVNDVLAHVLDDLQAVRAATENDPRAGAVQLEEALRGAIAELSHFATDLHASTDEHLQHEYFGGHAFWCSGRDEPHDDDQPYCERMVGGVDGVAEPDWNPAQIWVHNIHPRVKGSFTPAQYKAFEKSRSGVQLAFLDFDEKVELKWNETLINISSGAARTLAAQLIAAADIEDGITRVVAR